MSDFSTVAVAYRNGEGKYSLDVANGDEKEVARILSQAITELLGDGK